jgi:thiol-disulfide isomerase/thioredoxin
MILSALPLLVTLQGATTDLTLVPKGGMPLVGFYQPQQLPFKPEKPAGLKKAPADMKSPGFGEIKMGDKSFIVAYERKADGTPYVVVDTNRDGDLTNDEPIAWEPAPYKAKDGTDLVRHTGSAMVDFGLGPAALGAYIFDPKDADRAIVKNVLLYYPDYAMKGEITLGGKKHSVVIPDLQGEAKFGAKQDMTVLVLIDRNGDGRYDQRWEHFPSVKPFAIDGQSYNAKFDGTKLTLTPSSEKVAEKMAPPDFSVGKKVIPFKGKTLDGKDLSFPESFKGKLVLLDVWATWCGPCIGEIPHMKAAYSKFKDQGFEIFSVSIDDPNLEAEVKKFVQEKGTNWTQQYQANGWDSDIVKRYGITAIPFVLLVDGDTGEVVAGPRDLRGEKLSATVERELAKKKGTK